MPADFLINTEHGVVFSYGWGALSFADIKDHRARLRPSASFKPEFRQIALLSDAAEMKFTNDQIVTLACEPVFAPESRRALVAQGNPHFGLAKVFDGFSASQVIKVFRSLGTAAAWVNVPAKVAADAFDEIRQRHNLA